MGPNVTVKPEFAESFRVDGFVVCRRLLPRDKIRLLAEEGRRILNEHAAILELSDVRATDRERVALCVHHPHKLSKAILSLAMERSIVEILTAIVGPTIKMVQSQFFFKAPGNPGNAWHQDESAVPTRDRSLVAAWISIDPSTELNGCLKVIPGSHRFGYLYPMTEHGEDDRYDFPDRCTGFDESETISVETEPGDVVFFDGYLVHGSERNHSRKYRRALTFHYMNSYSLFPWKLSPASDASVIRPATLDYRDVVIVAGEDPYAAKGYSNESRPHLRRWKARP